MDFHSMSQRWEVGPAPKFLHTQIILQQGDEYFSVQMPQRANRPEEIPSIENHPSLTKIPQQHIWPKLENNITLCPNPQSTNIYVKHPRLTAYDGSASLSLWLREEARICELLLKNPHRNIARYWGCTAKDNRITGLCFEKYSETLDNRLEDGRPVDKEHCLRYIKAGLDHLHSLGIVHNDIRLDNVMFRDQHDDMPVVIDFDSCALQGCVLPDKQGPLPDGACTAEFENDAFGLSKLQEELENEEYESSFKRG